MSRQFNKKQRIFLTDDAHFLTFSLLQQCDSKPSGAHGTFCTTPRKSVSSQMTQTVQVQVTLPTGYSVTQYTNSAKAVFYSQNVKGL
jgi:hypothetical protein